MNFNMSLNDVQGVRDLSLGPPGQTIDLQGVASFAALVELLAHELGTTAGKIHGVLPNGSSFNELVGEIELNNQGFQRQVILFARPNAPLTIRFKAFWNETGRSNGEGAGIVADYFLGTPVERIVPQGRALARYIEDIFDILDRMVSLGQSAKLQSITVSPAALEAFESAEADNLVRARVTTSTAKTP
jgi:hypothetical protein